MLFYQNILYFADLYILQDFENTSDYFWAALSREASFTFYIWENLKPLSDPLGCMLMIGG